MPTVHLQRVYERSKPKGRVFLVDRLWPRGVKKSALKLDGWLKDAAPSDALRKWFGHDPKKWPEFHKRFMKELAANRDAWAPLRDAAKRGPVTLLFAAKDAEHCNAVVLRDLIESL